VGTHFNPGPPLKPEDEFCACEPPSAAEYVKAAGITMLTVLLGGPAWAAAVVVTHRLWAITTVMVGLAAGWTVNKVAGGHRSLTLGIMSAAATALAWGIGNLLLFIPAFSGARNRSLSWYDLLMLGLGAFMAYRLAGPKPVSKQL
jgi:hypothetical protein